MSYMLVSFAKLLVSDVLLGSFLLSSSLGLTVGPPISFRGQQGI